MKAQPAKKNRPWHWQLGLILLMPGLAFGQPPATATFRTQMQSATRLYENLEYEKSLGALTLARALAKTVNDLAEAAIHEAIVLADLGHREPALQAFREALTLRPDAQLPLKVSPKIEREFEGVRSQLKSTTTEKQQTFALSPTRTNDSPLLAPEPKPAPTAHLPAPPPNNKQTSLDLRPETAAQERGLLLKRRSRLLIGATALTATAGALLASRSSHNSNEARARHAPSSRISLNRTAQMQRVSSVALLSAAAITAILTVVSVMEDNAAPIEKSAR